MLSSHTERQGQESIYTVRDYTVECSRYEYTAIPIHIWGGGEAASKIRSQKTSFRPTSIYLYTREFKIPWKRQQFMRKMRANRMTKRTKRREGWR